MNPDSEQIFHFLIVAFARYLSINVINPAIMRTTIGIILVFLALGNISGQISEIDYFGQTPPGDSAIVFAPTIISLPGKYNQNGSFSADGKEFCFTVTNGEWSNSSLYYTRFENDNWLTPQKASFVSGSIWDAFFTPDGNNLIYTKITSVPDLWMLEKEGDSWGNPTKLASPVSSSSAEFSPSVSLDGTIYFFSRRSGNIYLSMKESGSYKNVEKVESPINDFSDGEPYIAPDGSYMIFCSSDRPDCVGQDDIYISYKLSTGWSNPIHLGAKINTAEIECSPNITPDNKYLLFTRREKMQTTKPSMILWVSASFIEELRPTDINSIIITDNHLSIFPNPAESIIFINHSENTENAYYSLFSLQGYLIMDGNLKNNSIDISQIPDGVYFMQIEINNRLMTGKVIKH